MSLVNNQRPLQPEYIPGSITDRESERKALKQALDTVHLPDVLLHGPRGTGKTLLTRQLITQLEDDIQHHYINCIHHNTEHKALRKLHTSITGENTPQGFHTSKLQRKIEKQLKHTRHLIVLDEADFLLQNNGNSLLYYLSRINKPSNLGTIIVSAHTASLQSQIDERTHSTLQPQRIGTEPYTSEQVYQILSQRARQSLEPTSLHHEALTYLASATQNTKLGLHWLRHTAQNTDQPITEQTLKQTQKQAHHHFTERTLSYHTDHHRTLYKAIRDFDDYPVNSGQTYTKYREHCRKQNLEPLSNRRISDYIQHLKLHGLIETKAHHGGKHGKTKEIQPTSLLQ
ncbi:MAG: orc1/cdc6 family replication initiation protein [Haloquadratum sp. J07HQX50]|nr:MAG: orc1/cdc6 family replication initiation protein [Haloquadratum sp. J07HQX50]